MTYQTFTRDPRGRHRYWARSFVGWRQIRGGPARTPGTGPSPSCRRPGWSAGDHAERRRAAPGRRRDATSSSCTAGWTGRSAWAAGDVADRAELDERLRAANPTFGPRVDEVNPDGDAELPDELLDGFVMVDCLACGDGPLKPDVVFFGETVPRDRVDALLRRWSSGPAACWCSARP